MLTMSVSTQTKYLLSTVTASPDDKGLPSCVISTINPDRDHDRMIPEGMDATSFMKAPTLFWAHGASERYAAVPIGSVTSLDVTPGQGIKATWRWLENDAFADRIRNAWDQGVVRGTSIGFRPITRTPYNLGGVDHETFELLELSLCPIPVNPEAVRALKSVGLTDEEIESPISADDIVALQVLNRDGTPAGPVIAVDPIKAELDAVQKRGRVVSAVNESRLRAAMDALANAGSVLTEVLAQLMPADDMDDEEHPKPKPMPVMALDQAETYSLQLAEDDLDLGGGLRLVLADEPGDSQTVFTLIDDTGHEPTFTIDPAVMRAVITDAVREQMQHSLIDPVGQMVQHALNQARGRVH